MRHQPVDLEVDLALPEEDDRRSSVEGGDSKRKSHRWVDVGWGASSRNLRTKDY